jgi:hypothetical protein
MEVSGEETVEAMPWFIKASIGEEKGRVKKSRRHSNERFGKNLTPEGPDVNLIFRTAKKNLVQGEDARAI